MFCKNCGKEIDDKAAICVYCGVSTKAECEEKEKTNGFGIAGFVIGIISLVIWGIIWIIVGSAIIGVASNL